VENQVANQVLLSHKGTCSTQAEALAGALDEASPGAGIFRSEDIEKGGEWRRELDRQLANAKCFILLYTDPQEDWSWCFYEAGRFINKGRKARPVFCVHPITVDPPSPLACLQTIRAERSDIEKWLERDFCPLLNCRRKQPEHKREAIVRDIERLVNGAGPLKETILKPYIWIEPKWAGDWTATANIPDDIFADAAVSIDPISSRQLRFADPPKLALLPFLQRIACEPARVGRILDQEIL
jgi:TIR domain